MINQEFVWSVRQADSHNCWHGIDTVNIRYRNVICGCSVLHFVPCGWCAGGESFFPESSEKAAAAGPRWKGDRCSGERAGAQQTAQRGSAGERDGPSVREHTWYLNYSIKHCFFLDVMLQRRSFFLPRTLYKIENIPEALLFLFMYLFTRDSAINIENIWCVAHNNIV